MARSSLSIRVELVEGRGERLWPRPGRIMAAARRHTFRELATAVDEAFARWDHAHSHQFSLADGTRIAQPDPNDDPDEQPEDTHRLTLNRLQPRERFAYEFDFGDRWLHLCTVGEQRIDPEGELGIVPAHPRPYRGWGVIPDQYGHRWDDDDGLRHPPSDTQSADLPPIGPWRHQRR